LGSLKLPPLLDNKIIKTLKNTPKHLKNASKHLKTPQKRPKMPQKRTL
jgi:hypothetical protein